MRGVNHLPLRPVCAAWKSLASAAGLEAGAAAHEMAACVEIERETDRQHRVPAAVRVLQREVDRGNRVWRDLLKFEILRTGADIGVAAGRPVPITSARLKCSRIGVIGSGGTMLTTCTLPLIPTMSPFDRQGSLGEKTAPDSDKKRLVVTAPPASAVVAVSPATAQSAAAVRPRCHTLSPMISSLKAQAPCRVMFLVNDELIVASHCARYAPAIEGITQAATRSWTRANLGGAVFVRELLDDIQTRYKAVPVCQSKLTQAPPWSHRALASASNRPWSRRASLRSGSRRGSCPIASVCRRGAMSSGAEWSALRSNPCRMFLSVPRRGCARCRGCA